MFRRCSIAARTWVLPLVALGLAGTSRGEAGKPVAHPAPTGVLHAAFVCTPGVFNSELMAPFDVLQHSVFRDSLNYIEPFIVTQDGGPFVSFEGIRMRADYSFEDVPRVDILVIPSTENSMGSDLENERYMGFLRDKVEEARWVMTLCDGAFPLAATGALNGRVATTFPGDRDAFAARFPEVDVRYDARFVVDGKFITSVGGAPSYEPAFYLVQTLYSQQHAERSAEGLVFDWDLQSVPHIVVGVDDEASPLAAFRWLLGDWVRRTRSGEAVETWRQRGRDTFEGRVMLSTAEDIQQTEWLRLESMGPDVFYVAKPRENRTPTAFRLIESEGDRFVFENPEHDFPQRIIYERVGENELIVWIEGQTDDGPGSIEFRFDRR